MKKRQMLLGCLLALVLSVSAVLSACSSGDNSPAGNKKSAGQIVGVWEAYDIFEPGLGNLREGAAYDDYKEQFHAIYAFSFAEDGTGLFTRFGIMKLLPGLLMQKERLQLPLRVLRVILRDRLTLRLAG